LNNGRGALFETTVIGRDRLTPSCTLIELERPEGFQDALPGQFISIRITDTFSPLLRRPYSIMDLDDSSIRILVKAVGKGSTILANKKAGDRIDMIGPLGGTHFPAPDGEACLVGGGTGIAPLVFAARSWKRGGSTGRLTLVYGAEGKEELLIDLADRDFDEMHMATMNGSAGFHGDVVSLLEGLAGSGKSPGGILYSCGPKEMIRQLHMRVEGYFERHYTSLETVMACGLGACRGCTVPVGSGERVEYRAVCSDGTVFQAGDISWEEWGER